MFVYVLTTTFIPDTASHIPEILV